MARNAKAKGGTKAKRGAASTRNVKDTDKTACAFPKFLQLPAEVRAMVWAASLPAGDEPATYLWSIDFARQLKADRRSQPLRGRPLIEVLPGPPAIQFACREAHDAVSTWAQEWRLTKVQSSETGRDVYVRAWDPERDALYVGRPEWESFVDRLGRTSMLGVANKVRHLALPSFTAYYSLTTLVHMMEYMKRLKRIYVVWGSQPTRKYLPLKKRDHGAGRGEASEEAGEDAAADADDETNEGGKGEDDGTNADDNAEPAEDGAADSNQNAVPGIYSTADPAALVSLEDVQYDGPLENHPLLELDPSGHILTSLLNQGELDSEAESELGVLLVELRSPDFSDEEDDDDGGGGGGGEEQEQEEDPDTSDNEFYYHPSPGEIEEARLIDHRAAVLHRARLLAAQSSLTNARNYDDANATPYDGGADGLSTGNGTLHSGLPWVAAPIQPRWVLEPETSETVRMELQDTRRKEPLVEVGLAKEWNDELYETLAFTAEMPDHYVDREIGECSLDFVPCKAVMA
jgi:hypothetical protein